jgi:hypothetical protein
MENDDDLVKKPTLSSQQNPNFAVKKIPKPPQTSTLVNKRTNWKQIRALRWKDLYEPMYLFLESETEPKGKSKSGLYRFKKIAKQFQLVANEIVLYTNQYPPDLLDDAGKPVVQLDLPLTYMVVPPNLRDIIIGSCFSSVFSGGFKGVDSCYRKIAQEYIGITRNDVSTFLKKTELKQLKRPTLVNELKPIITSRPLEMWGDAPDSDASILK